MNERRIHQTFVIGVLLKGAHALIECLAGLAIALVGTGTIKNFVNDLTQEELIEDPKDFVATHLHAMVQGYSLGTKHFYAFYLLSHGIVKLFLVAGLLRNKLWSYPASLVVLSLFIAYQVYRFSFTHGLGLMLLTLFDIIVIGLIWHEYILLRRQFRGSGA
jgi:uncharacterized membrane protein